MFRYISKSPGLTETSLLLKEFLTKVFSIFSDIDKTPTVLVHLLISVSVWILCLCLR